jgi:hypothetical protein
MTHIFHGDWTRYTPSPFPEGAPLAAMFARRASDSQDWYDYVRAGSHFGANSVVFTTYWAEGQNSLVVGAAVRDPTAMFPAGQGVYEIPDYSGGETQLQGKRYDPATETFSDLVMPSVVSAGMQSLLDRIAALEAASASAKPPQEAKPAKQGGE